MAAEHSMEEQKMEHFRETMDRLTAASHVQVDYFAEHKKIEGYYEENMNGKFFNCDRLMKQDNMFGTIQLGYNPNRDRVFIFANIKTSRYDTVASKYQREMRDYQKKALLKGNNENRAFVSKRKENAAVLIEKKERKPWTYRSVKTYLKRANMEAAQKILPFFSKEEETEELDKIKYYQKTIEEDIRENRIEQSNSNVEKGEKERKERENYTRELRYQALRNLEKENLLEAILIRKGTMEKNFLRRLNYAYDFQKKDIEEYYREKKRNVQERAEATNAEDVPEDENR